MTDDRPPVDDDYLDALLTAAYWKLAVGQAGPVFKAILDRGEVTLNTYLKEHGMPSVYDLPEPGTMTEPERNRIFQGWVVTLKQMTLEILAIPNPFLRVVVAKLLQETLKEMVVIGMGCDSRNQALQVELSAMMGAVGDA